MAKQTKAELKQDFSNNLTRTPNSIRNTTVIQELTDIVDSLEHVDNTVVTPADLSGQKGKLPKVNSAESGLEFIDEPVSATKANVANTLSAGDNITIADDPNDSTKTRISSSGGSSLDAPGLQALIDDSTTGVHGNVFASLNADRTKVQLNTDNTVFTPSLENLEPVLDTYIKKEGGPIDFISPNTLTSSRFLTSGSAADSGWSISTNDGLDHRLLVVPPRSIIRGIVRADGGYSFRNQSINDLPATYTAGGTIDFSPTSSTRNAIRYDLSGSPIDDYVYLLKGANGNLWVFELNPSNAPQTLNMVIRSPAMVSATYSLRSIATQDSEVAGSADDDDFVFVQPNGSSVIRKVTKSNFGAASTPTSASDLLALIDNTEGNVDAAASTDSTKIKLTAPAGGTGFQFSDTTTEEIETTAELPYFDSDGNRRNIAVSDFKSSLGIEVDTFTNLGTYTETAGITGTTFRSTGIAFTIFQEKTYDISFVPAINPGADPTTSPDITNRSTFRGTGNELFSALKTRTVGTNSIAADLTLTDHGVTRTIRLARLSDGKNTILLDPQNWPGILTIRVVDHITRATDLPDMPMNGEFRDAPDGTVLRKANGRFSLIGPYNQVFSTVLTASAIFANTNQAPAILPEKKYRLSFVPTASNEQQHGGSLTISGTDLEDQLQTRTVGSNSTAADLTLENHNATRNYRVARLANGNWLFDNQSIAGTFRLQVEDSLTRISDLEGMPSAADIAAAGANTALVKDTATNSFMLQAVTPVTGFQVYSPLDNEDTAGKDLADDGTSPRTFANTYTVQPSDFGKIVGINPRSQVMYVYFPESLPLFFWCDIVYDETTNGLVRVGTRNMIGRPNNNANNGPSWVKQDNSFRGFRTINSATDRVRRNTNFDFFDLWWANDSIRLTKVNTANWYKIDILRMNAFEPPANPGTSTTSPVLGRVNTSFTSTTAGSTSSPFDVNVGTINKFRQSWITN